jgi:hypothetical protein
MGSVGFSRQDKDLMMNRKFRSRSYKVQRPKVTYFSASGVFF